MIKKLKHFIFGGPVQRSSAETALIMSDAHSTFMEHAGILEREIREKQADIAAAHARLTGLKSEQPK